MNSCRPRGPLTTALVALLAGALLVGAAGALWSGLPFESESLAFPAQTLVAARGSGAISDGKLRMAADPSGADNRVLVPIKPFAADRFCYAVIRWGEVAAEPSPLLLWRSQGQLHMRVLRPRADGATVVRMFAEEGWAGDVDQLVIALPGGHTSELGEVEFRTPGWAVAATALWQEWTAYEGWTTHTLNYMYGGARPQLPVVFVVGAWGVVAVILAGLAAVVERRQLRLSVGAAIFLALWLLLDGRWAVDLQRQHAFTEARYGGKSWREKQLAGPDAPLFTFAEEIKAVLPPEPQRIVILTDDLTATTTTYQRLRLAYHLLPHATVTSLRAPPPHLRNGEYVLLLGRVSAITESPEALTTATFVIPVRPVLDRPLARLYQVVR